MRLSRRRLLQIGAGAVVAGAWRPQWAAAQGPEPLAGLFAGSTPENTPIPRGAALDANSRKVRDALIRAAGERRFAVVEEAPVYACSPGDPYYTVRHRGDAWIYKGRTIRWRVPAGAVTGGGSDRPLLLQEEGEHPLFGRRRRLRGWQVTIDHERRTLDATHWSVVNYGRSGSPTPQFGTVRRPDGVYMATGSGREWVGLVRAEEVAWGLAHAGTPADPDVGVLKAAIPHCVRTTMGENLHRPGRRHRAPALMSDSSGSGPLEMGMRIRLDPDMSDAEILARAPGIVPEGAAADGQSWADRRRLVLWMLLFAVRDYGFIVGDHTSDDLLAAQFEHGITADWTALIGSDDIPWGEIIRDDTANRTDGKARPATAGIPLSRLEVPAKSVF